MAAIGDLLQSAVHTASHSTYRIFAVFAGLLMVIIWVWSTFFGEISRFPSVNYKQSEWTYLQAKKRFITDARRLIAQGFEKVATLPFVVPARRADCRLCSFPVLLAS